jgi:hypothetical protein
MDAEISEKLASSFAVYAVQGDRTALEKAAADGDWAAALKNYGTQAVDQAKQLYGQAQPYLADPRVRNALLGAGAGGLVGMLQPKRKMRNALTYGLIGGLGGAGLTQVFGGGAPAASAPPAAGAANTTPPAAAGAANTTPPAAAGAANVSPPVAGQANKPAQPPTLNNFGLGNPDVASNSPYPITPEGRARAEKELANSGLSPVTGGQIGAASLGTLGAISAGSAANNFVTQRSVNKDWNLNAPKYLYDLAHGDGKTVSNGTEVTLTPSARANILGAGKIGKGGIPSRDYLPPSIQMVNGEPVAPGAAPQFARERARFNAAKTEMMRAAKPTAQQRFRGRLAGGAAGTAAGLATGLAGRNVGEFLWNLRNRQNYPSAF